MGILVTGASGFVGRHLVASLRRDGKSVTALVRGRAPLGADEWAGPTDLASLDTWPTWPSGIDTVVHLAAINPSRRQPATADALLRANAAGTAALARRARVEGTRRILFVSTANVHAPGPGLIRETDPLQPQSPYAQSKAAGEAAFWKELQGGETQGCVLRPAPVYGPGGRGNIAVLAKLARLPIPLPLEGLGGKRSLLAIDHLVSAVTLCLTAEGAPGETFLVADENPLTMAEIVRALRHGRNQPPQVFALPLALTRRLEPALPASGLETFVIDTRRLADKIGWRPKETAAASLSKMSRRGEL